MKARDLSNEDLAVILRSICVTGICPSRDEKEYLREAADRLEQKPETVTEFADRCRECGKSYIRIPDNATVCDLEQIRAEIEQLTSRYSISKERGGMGQVEWSDRLIKESDVLQIIGKYREEQTDAT